LGKQDSGCLVWGLTVATVVCVCWRVFGSHGYCKTTQPLYCLSATMATIICRACWRFFADIVWGKK